MLKEVRIGYQVDKYISRMTRESFVDLTISLTHPVIRLYYINS